MQNNESEITLQVDSFPYILNVKVRSALKNIENITSKLFLFKETGYFRVNYDSENWALLNDYLLDQRSAIHRLNRAQVDNH